MDAAVASEHSNSVNVPRATVARKYTKGQDSGVWAGQRES